MKQFDSGKNRYSKSQLESIADKAFITFANLRETYSKMATEGKRGLIGSMFPGKFTFESLKHRTSKVSRSLRYIYLINNELEGKKGQKTLENLLPREG